MSSVSPLKPEEPTNQNNAIIVVRSTSTDVANNGIPSDSSAMDVSSPCPSDTSSVHTDATSLSPVLAAAQPTLDHARTQILTVLSTHTDMLDRLAAGYWREMVGTKSAMDIQVMENIEAMEAWKEREEGYKSRIATLERRVSELEGLLQEKGRLLKVLGGAVGSGEITSSKSKETSPDS